MGDTEPVARKKPSKAARRYAACKLLEEARAQRDESDAYGTRHARMLEQVADMIAPNARC